MCRYMHTRLSSSLILHPLWYLPQNRRKLNTYNNIKQMIILTAITLSDFYIYKITCIKNLTGKNFASKTTIR